jgi:hypothetical protein
LETNIYFTSDKYWRPENLYEEEMGTPPLLQTTLVILSSNAVAITAYLKKVLAN